MNSATTPSPQKTTLCRRDLDPIHALFNGDISGLVATFYSNERPLQGLAGQLDWYLGGSISNYLKKGAIEGQEEECVYIPVLKKGQTYHVLLLGVGMSESPGKRQPLKKSLKDRAKRNILSLNLDRMGISAEDLGGIDEKKLLSDWEGAGVCIVQ